MDTGAATSFHLGIGEVELILRLSARYQGFCGQGDRLGCVRCCGLVGVARYVQTFEYPEIKTYVAV